MSRFTVVGYLVTALLVSLASKTFSAHAEEKSDIDAILKKAKPAKVPADFLKRKMEALRALWPEFPKHLAKKDAAREPSDFDVNTYFTILTHIKMEEGYVLDYVYHFDGMGGRPVLYARRQNDAPFAAEKDLLAAKDYEGIVKWINHVRADDTPEGYLELTLLSRFGGAFYIYWHSIYSSEDAVCDKSELKEIIAGLERKFDAEAALKCNAEPGVSLSPDGAIVTLYTFNRWKGLIRVTCPWNRAFPHVTRDSWREEILVPYNCGIVF